MEDVSASAAIPLDRVSERRDDGDWITTLLGDPATHRLGLS
jgi:hypothetical protein